MTEIKLHTKIIVKRPELNQEIKKILNDFDELLLLEVSGAQQPDLLIYELGGDTEREFSTIESLIAEGGGAAVFLLSQNTASEILLKAFKIGVKEFFALPLRETELSDAIKKFIQKKKDTPKSAPRMGRVINILGSKGGIGTTTTAVNLASGIAQKTPQSSVVLLDMNTLLGEIPLFLDLKPEYHWGEILNNIDRLDRTFLSNILSAHSSGISVLPSPGSLNGLPAMSFEIMARLIGFMKTEFDFVVVDCGHTLNDLSLKVVEMSDTLLLLSILNIPCLANTNKLMTTICGLGYLPEERVEIVINRYTKNSEISVKEATKGLKKELFWLIPNDYPTTMKAINQGKTLAQIAPRASISKNFKTLAEKLAPTEETKKKRWLFF